MHGATIRGLWKINGGRWIEEEDWNLNYHWTGRVSLLHPESPGLEPREPKNGSGPSQQTRNRRGLSQPDKVHLQTLQLAPHLMWKTECFSPQTGNTAEMTMPTDPSFLFNIKPERSPSQWKTRNINKSLQIGNKEIKLSLFVENIIAYVENPMESTKTNNYLN